MHTIDSNEGLRIGGVIWKPAPLKKTVRIVEKLALDPLSKDALDECNVEALDASSILDTTRGMFICSSMLHATAVLHEFKRLEANQQLKL